MLQRRLLAWEPVRRYALRLAGSAVVAAVLIVVLAGALADLIASAVHGHFAGGAFGIALAAVVLRAGHHAVAGAIATRAAAAVKAQLRGEVLGAAARLGPGWLAGQRSGELATLAGRGLDGLDGFLADYLPQAALAVAVPAAVLLRLGFTDLTALVTVLVTVPLLPLLGALIGWQTGARTKGQWRQLSRLGGHFLDMVTGLSTLRAFGRDRAEIRQVRAMAERYRTATVRTLRLAFLSALVLELVSTIAVALIAVPVGLRLLHGGITLSGALLVLLLAPEAYLPLRAMGAKFHASQEGLAAAGEAFAVLDAAEDPRPEHPFLFLDNHPAPNLTPLTRHGLVQTEARVPPFESLVFDRVDVRFGDTIAVREASLRIERGHRVALCGPSGGGKSTLLGLVLGFVTPSLGRVLVNGIDLSTVDLDAWRRQIAWVPQRAHLFAASVADNIRLGTPEATLDDVVAAARSADADRFINALPGRYGQVLGERGHATDSTGLSSGQRQRIALARAWLRVDAPLLLLDEPTARLDPESEAAVVAAARQLALGRTAVVVAHREALLTAVDRVIDVVEGRPVERTRLVDGRPITKRQLGPRVLR